MTIRTMTRITTMRLPAGAVAVLLASLLSLPAFAANFGDVTVRVEPFPTGVWPVGSHGYSYYRVYVANKSTEEPARVELRLPAEPWAGLGGLITQVTRDIEVAPGARAVVPLAFPDLPVAGRNLHVEINGRPLLNPIPLPPRAIGSHNTNQPTVLLDKGAARALSAQIVGGSSGRRGSPNWVTCPDTPAEWPADWLAYGQFDGIILEDRDVQAMPFAVRDALWRYVELGGTVVVFADISLPRPAYPSRGRLRRTFPWNVDAPAPKPEDARRLTKLEAALGVPSAWRSRTRDLPLMRQYSVGYGVFVLASRDILERRLESSFLSYFLRAFRAGRTPWGVRYSVSDANRRFRVVEELKVPVRGLFVVMLLFVILVGPVNIIVLSLTKRKIWLLWTTPAISLLTSLAVVGYATFSEGWGARIRTSAITLVDETDGRATTLGWTAFYSPLTPGGGLRFPYEVELTPQVDASGRSGSARTVDLTRDQRLASGWVAARTPAHFRVRRSNNWSGRVTAERRRDGAVFALNGLGGDAVKLFVADASGQVYAAKDIAAGERAPLRTAGRLFGTPSSLRNVYTRGWLDRARDYAANPQAHLRPGCYIAVLKASPFIEAGLESHSEWKAQTVIYGVMKEPLRAR